jgi:16S rRNA (adenine1518-N6/adenine1519-N6)-dimethyltransferase
LTVATPRPLDLTNVRTVRAVMRRVGLQTSSRLGQHFLIDAGVLDDIVAALEPVSGAEVLEIGCGIGTLTQALAAGAGRVVAIDIDPACVAAARITQRHAGNVTVLQADARHVDPPALGFGAGWLAAGNLPYQLTGVLLGHLFELPAPPAVAVFLLQREVAIRLTAPPGGWSLATVAMRSLAEVERIRDVPPGAFDPAPAVHSSLVRLHPVADVDHAERRAVIELARRVFQQRRKTLRHGVAHALGDPRRAAEALATAGVDEQRRPGTLGLHEWRLLARAAAMTDPDADAAG